MRRPAKWVREEIWYSLRALRRGRRPVRGRGARFEVGGGSIEICKRSSRPAHLGIVVFLKMGQVPTGEGEKESHDVDIESGRKEGLGETSE